MAYLGTPVGAADAGNLRSGSEGAPIDRINEMERWLNLEVQRVAAALARVAQVGESHSIEFTDEILEARRRWTVAVSG